MPRTLRCRDRGWCVVGLRWRFAGEGEACARRARTGRRDVTNEGRSGVSTSPSAPGGTLSARSPSQHDCRVSRRFGSASGRRVCALWLPGEWRRRRASWVALAVLVGVGAGAVLGVASGARRTDSAYERFVAQSSPADLMVASGYVGLGPTVDLRTVEQLPGVSSTSSATFLPAIGRTSSGRRFLPFEAATGAATNNHFGNTVDRWKVLSGRRAHPHRLDEAVASFEFSRQFQVRVGDTVDLRFLPVATAARLLPSYLASLPDYAAGRATRPRLASVFDGPHVKVRIVGVEAAPYEFPPRGVVLPSLVMTPAFARRYADGLVREEFMHVRLASDTDPRAFASQMGRQLQI